MSITLTQPVVRALNDWLRLYTFNFANSFVEFKGNSPATIASGEVIADAGITVDTVTVNENTITAVVSGGTVGQNYDIKAKAVLSTGAKLSIPGIYSVVAPGASTIAPLTLNHIIDPEDDTTWTRDFQFPFGGPGGGFAELLVATPPTIASASFPSVSGISNSTPVPSGTTVVVRMYASEVGTFNVRCQVTLSDTIGTQLSIPGILNVFTLGD